MAYCPNPSCPSPQNPPPANFCQACGTSLTLSDRYRLQTPLGRDGCEGGSGRTFLATDAADKRYVVKQFLGEPAPDNAQFNQAQSAQLFEAEAERLRRLGEHPQIPRLVDAVETGVGQFWVQEFVAGDNLAVQVAVDGPWSQTRVRSLLTSLVPVIQYIHSFDIIHRDIKPANIISTDNSTKTLPVLVDFGAAKWVRKEPAKTVIGSADYSAPEQTIGQATFASDIYSLGLTCLHLLTSIHPFSLYSVAEDRWVWQDYLSEPVEPRFAQVLNQMVARSLQHRYAEMDQVALDLQIAQSPLRYVPQQLLARAKETVAPFIDSSLNPFATMLPSHKKALPNRVLVAADSQTWTCCDRITQNIGVTQAIALNDASVSNPIMATAGTDGSIRLWRLSDRHLLHTFTRRRFVGDGHTAAVSALRFHPDGRALYSASADGTIKEWDSAEYQLLNTLKSAGWTPTNVVVTSDGTQLIAPYNDGQIVLWDIATLERTARLAQHQKSVNAIALSKKGDLLISASNDGTIKLWRMQVGRSPQLAKTIRLDKSGLAASGVVAIALHTSNAAQPIQQIIAATSTGLVQRYVLDAQMNPSEPIAFYQSPMPVTAFALSNNGTLAIGSEDRVLTLWDIDTGACVAELAHDWGLVAIAFSADSQTLITASADEVISVWQRTAKTAT